MKRYEILLDWIFQYSLMQLFNVNTWQEEYKAKIIKPSDLNSIIKPGSRIYIGSACSEPIILTNELIHHKSRWTDCELIHFLMTSNQKYFSRKYPTRYRHNTLSIIGSERIRNALNEGKSDFTQIKSSDIPKFIKAGSIQIDVALIQVSPPDVFGFCSLGINVDINWTVVNHAKTIVAQINPQMPRTRGDSSINFEQLDFIVIEEQPLLEFSYELDDTDNEKMLKIGRYLSRLIENGSTLNVGLGKFINEIWAFLENKRDLAIYSEGIVLSPTLIALIANGVINCKKNEFPNIMTSFVLGTNAEYTFLNKNPFFKFYPTEYITNLNNIVKNNKLISIYGAIAIDLSGQITNHLPDRYYGGIGGELDFIHGTGLKSDNKTIIVLPSTTKHGNKSRIVPVVQRSIISGCDVHYVVTEWGVARLIGKNMRHRALELIGISHPDFRKDLLSEAKKLRYVYEDQILPLTQDGVVVVYPEAYEWEFTTQKGQLVKFRPVKPTDEQLIQQFFYQLDERDRIFRFLTPRETYIHKEAQLEVNIDYNTTMVIIGLIGDDKFEEIVCGCSFYYDFNCGNNIAEIAVTTSSDWQNQGLGGHVFKKMCKIGQEKGISGFIGEVFSENKSMLRLVKSLPYKVIFENYDDTFTFMINFNEKASNTEWV